MQPNRHPHAAASRAPDPQPQLQLQLQAWLERAAARPDRVGFYPLLRGIDALHPGWPRLGRAARPADEPLRVGQSPELDFAPAPLAALLLDGPVPRLRQRIFGLLGPHGPLPLHLSELARDRTLHHADPTLQAFLDMLTHRFALLFYRAWARAQPLLDLERPDSAGFAHRIGAWFGAGLPGLRERDALPDAERLFFAGRLARQVRDADGLTQWIGSSFEVPVRVLQWQRHRMQLEPSERCRLQRLRQGSGHAQRLGRGAVLGASVPDVQHRFRLVLGPLAESRFRDFLPGGRALPRLHAMVRQWVGLEFSWDLQLLLPADEVPPLRLGAGGRLGSDLWLHQASRKNDAADLVIDVERCMARRVRP